MIFSDLTFIAFFIFLILVYRSVNSTGVRKLILLATSIAFYGYWDIRFIPLLLIISILAYIAGLLVSRCMEANRSSSAVIVLSSALMLAPLIYFKYALFIAGIIASAISEPVETKWFSVILPLGISFFTFQGISYIIDVRNQRTAVEPSLLNILIYITFFPQLVAGPIVRAGDFLYQLKDLHFANPVNSEIVASCMARFLWGVTKKVFIADRLGSVIVDPVFGNMDQYSGGTILLATFAFGLQIYADFSAYSDMAISIARLLGFKLKENFDAPYLTLNIRTFWRRWHISLSNIIKDLIYIPLGGSKDVSRVRGVANGLFAFALCGLWHGANWNFVLWGTLHGAALIIHRLYSYNKLFPLHWVFCWLITQGTVMAFWYVFRVPDLHTAISGLNQIVTSGLIPREVSPDFIIICLGFYLVILAEQSVVYRMNRTSPEKVAFPAISRNIIASLALISLNIVLIDPDYGSKAFVYFQF